MRRFHVLAVTGLTVLAVVAATPANAATAVTKRQVRHSLLTAAQLGDGWHRIDSSSGEDSADIQGCGSEGTSARPAGLRFQPQRDFQYGQVLSLVNEQIYSFRTVRNAKAGFVASVRELRGCDSFTVDGKTWHVKRLTMPSYADQRAMYRFSGPVATASGDVPMTMFLVATRYGRHEVTIAAMLAGQLTSTDRTVVKRGVVRIAKAATLKVQDRLGR